MGMGRATEKIEILNARPPLPAALVCRGIACIFLLQQSAI